ncbi:MAG: glycosyltransferase [Anaerolineales bacterium]
MQGYEAYRRERIDYWNRLASHPRRLKRLANYYHRLLQHQFRLVVPPGSRVLELGSGEGDLLNALAPGFGVGIDYSVHMVQRAKTKYKHLHFVQSDAHQLPLDTKFDYVILSDLLNDVWDVQAVLEQIGRLSQRHTRILINAYSKFWQFPLGLAQRLTRGVPNLEQNWLTVEDMQNILRLADLGSVRHDVAILLPVNIPLLSGLANRFLVRIWPFNFFALTNFLIARPFVKAPREVNKEAVPKVSVIIPARNEEGNIASIFQRVPELGKETELIFVEGHSRDGTYQEIRRQIERQARTARLLKQAGVGKADAVWQGFKIASGDILMILDADLSVPPEDLSRFYAALTTGKADFANGVRLVYPMEEGAMRPLNLLGNKFFSLAFSWLLGQPIKDTLCGTKGLWRRDYEVLRKHWQHFGKSDPFGDFDLLFGASKLGLKIRDLPIRYRERTYGSTNIDRWRHGWLLLRMVFNAARWLKFV